MSSAHILVSPCVCVCVICQMQYMHNQVLAIYIALFIAVGCFIVYVYARRALIFVLLSNFVRSRSFAHSFGVSSFCVLRSSSWYILCVGNFYFRHLLVLKCIHFLGQQLGAVTLYYIYDDRTVRVAEGERERRRGQEKYEMFKWSHIHSKI